MPGSFEARGHHRQCKGNLLGVALLESIQQPFYFGKRGVIELADRGRQRLVEFRQRVLGTEHRQHLVQVGKGGTRGRIDRQPGSNLIDAAR